MNSFQILFLRKSLLDTLFSQEHAVPNLLKLAQCFVLFSDIK